jgi:hypothetical protein
MGNRIVRAPWRKTRRDHSSQRRTGVLEIQDDDESLYDRDALRFFVVAIAGMWRPVRASLEYRNPSVDETACTSGRLHFW